MHAPAPELIPPEILLLAYRSGVFPMADAREDEEVFWVEPRKRAILPLQGFALQQVFVLGALDQLALQQLFILVLHALDRFALQRLLTFLPLDQLTLQRFLILHPLDRLALQSFLILHAL